MKTVTQNQKYNTSVTADLEGKIGIEFKDKAILVKALVHRSYLNENPGFSAEHNERLEFLGDAVLELIVTEYLYIHYPTHPEGELTSLRASLVNSTMLASLAGKLQLDKYLYLSKGESKDQGKARQYILANAFEALIGAIFLDRGITASKKFIGEQVLVQLPYVMENQLYIDAKSHFQELTQEKLGITPNYRVLEESGPDHAKTFKIGAFIQDELIAEGVGQSKQEGEFNAAKAALVCWQWKTN